MPAGMDRTLRWSSYFGTATKCDTVLKMEDPLASTSRVRRVAAGSAVGSDDRYWLVDAR
jgi:hypothetical protein